MMKLANAIVPTNTQNSIHLRPDERNTALGRVLESLYLDTVMIATAQVIDPRLPKVPSTLQEGTLGNPELPRIMTCQTQAPRIMMIDSVAPARCTLKCAGITWMA